MLARNSDLVAFLRRIVGYALTGVTREHVLAFLYGGGANGKSTSILPRFGGQSDYAASFVSRSLS